MVNVEFSPTALRKLLNIRKYITNELNSPVAAQKTVDKIMNAIERLELFPESAPLLCALYNNTPVKYSQARFFVCGHYIVIYNYDLQNVRILQVYHGKEDYIRHLFQT